RPRLEGADPQNQPGISHQARARLRRQALGSLRQVGRLALAHHFRMVSATRGYDLYHEPNFIPLPCNRPTVATIHDLSVVLHPEWHPADRVRYFEREFKQGLKRCSHFLAISEFARQEIIHHLGIRPEQITRTYMGICRRSTTAPGPAYTRRFTRDLDCRR